MKCVTILIVKTNSLSDLKNLSENSAERVQILRAFTLRRNACLPHLPILPVNSHSIDQSNGGICTGQADLQPISLAMSQLAVEFDLIMY